MVVGLPWTAWLLIVGSTLPPLAVVAVFYLARDE